MRGDQSRSFQRLESIHPLPRQNLESPFLVTSNLRDREGHSAILD
jgi:hypothetical protein